MSEEKFYMDSMGVQTTKLGEYVDHMEIGLCAHMDLSVPTEVIHSWFASDEWREIVKLCRESKGMVVDTAYCPECNVNSVTMIDEDGCCTTCGADAVPCKGRLTREKG